MKKKSQERMKQLTISILKVKTADRCDRDRVLTRSKNNTHNKIRVKYLKPLIM